MNDANRPREPILGTVERHEGAIDLSQSLGVPADAQHPAVQAAIERIPQASRKRDVPFCAIPRAPGQYEHWRSQGVNASCSATIVRRPSAR
ncbi:hypothetical protein [Burkholderia gladioli]|uniref:hypothetical protein n=1 Tax=Burkholderia gladioli TaxID=28095 RepID=UPI001FC88DE2|nr:hypothetical protein [Burkholderia gladioli]